MQHQYLYDGMGNQVQDVATTPAGVTTTYHIYDGHNVQLAKYQLQTPSGGADNMGVLERYLYGSDKLGTLLGTNSVMGISYSSGYTHWWVWGPASKEYEIHDHLGNVRATVSSAGPNSMGMVSVLNYYNYYAFGSYQPQRTYEPGGEYSFGFNGQEKKDDYMGAGNENHALYWEYETRIGRRWNMDPVVKNDQSPYEVFSNSPIWKIDPNGDDDFFNAKGEFIKREGKGSVIKILNSNKETSFSDFLSNGSVSSGVRGAVALGVFNHYAHAAGVKGTVGGSFNFKEKNSPASTQDGKVRINFVASPKIYKYESNYGNVISTLVHEKFHQQQDVNGNGGVTNYADHANIYLNQFLDKSFSEGTTSGFRLGQIGSFSQYLMNSLAQDPNSANAIEILEKFNKENKLGYFIDIEGTMSDSKNLAVTIYQKGKQLTGKIKYVKKDSTD